MNNDYEKFSAYLNDLGNKIDYYFALITIPIGIIFNTLSVFIFLRKNLNKTNMGFFNFCLSISNSFTLIYFIFVSDSKIFFNYDLKIKHDVLCRIIPFIRRVIREVSPWIEVLITFDRLIYVKFPTRFKFMHKKLILAEIMGLMLLILSVISIENFFYSIRTTVKIIPAPTSKNMTNNTIEPKSDLSSTCTGSNDILLASDLISIILRTFIPIITMVVLNYILISFVLHTKSKMKNNQNKAYCSRQLNFTLTVIAMDMYFLALNLPVSVMYILRYAVVSSWSGLLVNFVWKICYNIANLYYATLFFFNIIFNRIFREEILFMICFPFRSKSSMFNNSGSKYFSTRNKTITDR